MNLFDDNNSLDKSLVISISSENLIEVWEKGRINKFRSLKISELQISSFGNYNTFVRR